MSSYKPERLNKYTPLTGCGFKPPFSHGKYHLRDSSGTPCYIGETCNLSRRNNEHIRSGKLSGGGIMKCKTVAGLILWSG